MEYGFPSGTDLVKEICGTTGGIEFNDTQPGLLEKGQIIKIMHNMFGESHTEEFGKALYYSQSYSIDAFLERRPKFTDIGKFAIALFILRKEISANLSSFNNREEGCYQYLFDKLDAKWEELYQNRASFITFNYDRSLEQFLFTSFHNRHGKSESECAKVVSNIPIIHVHGSLGKLPWQAADGIAYSGNMESLAERDERSAIVNGTATRASKQIRVIPERQSTSDEFQEAFKLLSKAQRIYFLGFGYNSVNLQRLHLLDVPSVKESIDTRSEIIPLRGTGWNLEEAEKNFLYDKWGIWILDTSSKSLQFLRRYAQLD